MKNIQYNVDQQCYKEGFLWDLVVGVVAVVVDVGPSLLSLLLFCCFVVLKTTVALPARSKTVRPLYKYSSKDRLALMSLAAFLDARCCFKPSPC